MELKMRWKCLLQFEWLFDSIRLFKQKPFTTVHFETKTFRNWDVLKPRISGTNSLDGRGNMVPVSKRPDFKNPPFPILFCSRQLPVVGERCHEKCWTSNKKSIRPIIRSLSQYLYNKTWCAKKEDLLQTYTPIIITFIITLSFSRKEIAPRVILFKYVVKYKEMNIQ